MDPKEELFERFGKELVERVRDSNIDYMDSYLEQKAPLSHKHKGELEGLTPAQMNMIKEMIVDSVDGTLHDLLFMLEGADWIHLRLENEDTILDDIRRAASGDLQGYIFIWQEKYSKTRLFETRSKR